MSYKKKTIKLLIGAMILFFIVFLLSLLRLWQGKTLFNLGLDSPQENYLVMLLCLASIGYAFYEILKIEHE